MKVVPRVTPVHHVQVFIHQVPLSQLAAFSPGGLTIVESGFGKYTSFFQTGLTHVFDLARLALRCPWLEGEAFWAWLGTS